MDLTDIKGFFMKSLEAQLTAEHAFETPHICTWFQNIEDVALYSTDNDKKVIGSMNDFINQLSVHFKYIRHLKDSTDISAASIVNDIPMSLLNYQTPIEVMKQLKTNA